MNKLALVLAAMVVASPVTAEPILELHYSPTENLEQIDVDLIDSAETSIDLAAYSFTDPAIVDAIYAAATRGVKIRLYLDQKSLSHMKRTNSEELKAAPNISLRTKRSGILQHLKSYVVDGKVLRAGAANFTKRGLTRQDNDLWIVRDQQAVHRFESEFEQIYAKGRPIQIDQRMGR